MNYYDNVDYLFCLDSLRKVSRSFYLNTVILRSPLVQYVTIAYLLCRIADTIEDDPILESELKVRYLDNYLSLIKSVVISTENSELMVKWDKFLGEAQPTTDEYELCLNLKRVLNVFESFPHNIKLSVLNRIAVMINGMKATVKRKPDTQGLLVSIKDEIELDQYCYFVAGVVGELLTDLFCTNSKYIDNHMESKLRETTVQFGLGLQYVNIIKDLRKDLKRGVLYYPKSIISKYNLSIKDFISLDNISSCKGIVDEMIILTERYLNKALHYTLTIPKRERSIRLFCLWPLFFALATLSQVKKNKEDLLGGKDVKISRSQVRVIIYITSLLSLSNTGLRILYWIYKPKH